MSFEAIVYFEGPLSKWKRAPDDREIIFRRTFRWLFMAEGMARAKCKDLKQCFWLVRNLERNEFVAGVLPASIPDWVRGS